MYDIDNPAKRLQIQVAFEKRNREMPNIKKTPVIVVKDKRHGIAHVIRPREGIQFATQRAKRVV